MIRCFFVLLLLTASCKSDDVTPVPEGCIDESKISPGPCTMELAPVCGCNNATYSNACAASCAGITSWTAGACK